MTNDFAWLIASTTRGHLVSATAADDAVMVAGFLRVHGLSGHTVERLTFDEARERYYAPRPAAPADLPPIGTLVTVPLGLGTVVAHLRWPDHHPTLAGRVAAQVRGAGFESAVFQGQIRPHVPAPEPPAAAAPPPAPLPAPRRSESTQPVLF